MNNKKATQSKMREREKMNNGSKKENRRQNKRSECIQKVENFKFKIMNTKDNS